MVMTVCFTTFRCKTSSSMSRWASCFFLSSGGAGNGVRHGMFSQLSNEGKPISNHPKVRFTIGYIIIGPYLGWFMMAPKMVRYWHGLWLGLPHWGIKFFTKRSCWGSSVAYLPESVDSSSNSAVAWAWTCQVRRESVASLGLVDEKMTKLGMPKN